MTLLADVLAPTPRIGRQALAMLAAYRSGGPDQAGDLLDDIVNGHTDEEKMSAVSELFTALVRINIALTDEVAGPGGAYDYLTAAIAELALKEHAGGGG